MYCIQKRKPTAAWNFIASASQSVQALGLQHNMPSSTSPEESSQKADLFWTIYSTEKMLSLRLGRSSTFRDQDITLNRLSAERPGGSFLAELAPSWVSLASIQGRIYDEIYSPGALMQTSDVRTSRARILAADLNTVMQQAEEIHVGFPPERTSLTTSPVTNNPQDNYRASKSHILGQGYHEIARRADRVVGLCLLTLIYRSIPSENPATSAFFRECVETAREALNEHEKCVSVIDKGQGKTVMLEAYINWSVVTLVT